MYIEKPDNFKDAPVISPTIVVMTLIHLAVLFFSNYAIGTDNAGYSISVFHGAVYFTSFLLAMSILVGVRSRSAGLLDMFIVFLTFLFTFFAFK